MSAIWYVETRTKEEREQLTHETGLGITETYQDGSCNVRCPDTESEDDLVEYCEDTGIDLELV